MFQRRNRLGRVTQLELRDGQPDPAPSLFRVGAPRLFEVRYSLARPIVPKRQPASADRRCDRAGGEFGSPCPIALRRSLAARQGMSQCSPVEQARIAGSESHRCVERNNSFARCFVAMEEQRSKALQTTQIIEAEKEISHRWTQE